MIRSVSLRAAVCVVVCATALPARADHARSPLFGALTPGPHAVGFAKMEMKDPTRPMGAKRGPDGAVSAVQRARRLAVHVWYPASANAAGRRMTFADYIGAHLSQQGDDAIRTREDQLRGFLGQQFGTISNEAWSALRTTPLLATADAPPADGRFPLVVGMLRPLSTSITNEYLASHGYAVAMIQGDSSEDPEDPGAALEIGVRDMEFAIAQLRALPYIDQAALAALGFSGSGFSQILLAMRHPDIDAVCDLESAIFDDRVMWPLSRGWGYSVEALRIPFLHTYGVPLSARENRIGDFERMRYSTRYRYLVDAPGLHHWDFATEGMAASTVLGLRSEQAPRLRQAFETTNRYVLAFFDAHVKGDGRAHAFLRNDPVANGAPVGLVTMRELPRVEPAPTTDAFAASIADRGIEAALQIFQEARARDPEAPLFREAQLNMLGYRLLRTGKRAESLVMFRKAVELYPDSVNLYDSLGEALEAAGEHDEALAVTRRGLEAASRPGAPSGPVGLLKARLERLTSGGSR